MVFKVISMESYYVCSLVPGASHLSFVQAVACSSHSYLRNRKLSINEKDFVNCGPWFKARMCGWFFTSPFASRVSDL